MVEATGDYAKARLRRPDGGTTNMTVGVPATLHSVFKEMPLERLDRSRKNDDELFGVPYSQYSRKGPF